MRCIECDQSAEYIFNGNSYCKYHKDNAKYNDDEIKIKYLKLVESITFKSSALASYERHLGKGNILSYKHKLYLITKLTDMITKYNILPKTVERAIFIAINKKQYKLEYLYKVMMNINKEQSKTDNNCKDDDRVDNKNVLLEFKETLK